MQENTEMKFSYGLNNFIRICALLCGSFFIPGVSSDGEENSGNQKYKIDGKVAVPFTNDQEWLTSTRILVDGGEYIGFLK